jgi:hypothetical protein
MERPWLSGDFQTLDSLVRGHVMVRDPQLYVPFSSGIELTNGMFRTAELRFATNIGEAVHAFWL